MARCAYRASNLQRLTKPNGVPREIALSTSVVKLSRGRVFGEEILRRYWLSESEYRKCIPIL